MRGLKQDDERSVVTEGGAHQKSKDAEQVRIPALPKAPQFRSWRLAVRDEVASASGDPDAGFAWIRQVELPEATEKSLLDSGKFASLDAKLAAGIAKVAQGDLGRTINNAKEKFAI